MNLLNEKTQYTFSVTYNNGETHNISCGLEFIENYANADYHFPRKDVETGVASIRLMGETQVLNDRYWDGFHKAKDMSRVNVLTGRW